LLDDDFAGWQAIWLKSILCEALLEFIFSLGSELTIDTRSSQQVWLAYRRILLSSGNASEAAEWAAKAYEAARTPMIRRVPL
jgi:hypothetical protein